MDDQGRAPDARMPEPPLSPSVMPPPPPAPHSPTVAPASRAASGSVTAAVVLIVVGVVFLLMRLVPSIQWWSFWPLIIVLAGLIQAFTPGKEGWSVHRVFDGFVTVAIGGVFLATTMGVVGWGVWMRILGLWPVLIIAVGFDLLGKALHTSWLRALGSLAIIGALAYGVSTASGGFDDFGVPVAPGGVRDVSLSEPVGTADSANLTLDSGVATVRVASGDRLIGITGSSPWGEPSLDVERVGSEAKVRAVLGDDEGMHMWPGDGSARFDVELSDRVVWDIRMNTGVSALRADLSDIDVRSLDLRPGVADCDVQLGDVPTGEREARVDVRAGVSSVAVRIPDDAEARVEIESGLSGSTVRGRFEDLDSGVWETPGYEAAKDAGRPVWLIRVRSGIGTITIDTY